MSRLTVNKKVPPDLDLLRIHRINYDRAYAAAWTLLSDDRRFLGAPTFKKQICHVAAIRAVGSETSLLKEIQKASGGGDPKGIEMLREGYDKACSAAKKAIVPIIDS